METLVLSGAGNFHPNFIVVIAVFPPVQTAKGSLPADSLNQYQRFLVCKVDTVTHILSKVTSDWS